MKFLRILGIFAENFTKGLLHVLYDDHVGGHHIQFTLIIYHLPQSGIFISLKAYMFCLHYCAATFD